METKLFKIARRQNFRPIKTDKIEYFFNIKGAALKYQQWQCFLTQILKSADFDKKEL